MVQRRPVAQAGKEVADPIRHLLLDWYRRHARALPWRQDRDAYRVLVSEVMLQQTRAATVIPYYERFLGAFPNVEALAAASVEEVLTQWSGLGYYARARRLHAAAGQIVARGSFPRSVAELKTLPGVGAYTAAAVASIAFGEAVAVVDGNVERLAARLLALPGDPGRGPGRHRVRRLAAALLEPGRPGDSNQAMMELGATVCTARAPRCGRCPLISQCRARSSGRPEDFPRRRPGRRSQRQRRLVVVVWRGGRFLLARNHDRETVLGGLWEFPWVPREGGRSDWEAALGGAFGGSWSIGARLGRARHAITYRSLELDVWMANVLAPVGEVAEGTDQDLAWLTPEEIATRPTTSMVSKVLRCARGAGVGPGRDAADRE